jgi:hypothetical protein
MNVERLLKLADHIEALPPEKFEMGDYFCRLVFDVDDPSKVVGRADEEQVTREFLNEECGTAACIAGHAVHLFGGDEDWECVTANSGWATHDVASGLLGLSHTQASYLFFGEWAPQQLMPDSERYSRARAAAAIRDVAAGL